MYRCAFGGARPCDGTPDLPAAAVDRKSTRLNSSHSSISYAVFCLKKKKQKSHDVEDILVAVRDEPDVYRAGHDMHVTEARRPHHASTIAGHHERSLAFFFLNATAATEIYTLSLHDALPIYRGLTASGPPDVPMRLRRRTPVRRHSRSSRCRRRSEEHTSELQSQFHLVCRLLLEKKKAEVSRRGGHPGGRARRARRLQGRPRHARHRSPPPAPRVHYCRAPRAFSSVFFS